ncbi:hypothetical protein D9611_010658 [Ephemerocybe angulata]|uniref:Uncharacterized protein n=1 Tax=Ephemerocybe angulata TaxID=980116 RepID=A0A8H5BDG1_9AGAR|nr:hypothetical protein D9611_010658 [Tulosesus angulatus]
MPVTMMSVDELSWIGAWMRLTASVSRSLVFLLTNSNSLFVHPSYYWRRASIGGSVERRSSSKHFDFVSSFVAERDFVSSFVAERDFVLGRSVVDCWSYEPIARLVLFSFIFGSAIENEVSLTPVLTIHVGTGTDMPTPDEGEEVRRVRKVTMAAAWWGGSGAR